MADDKFKNNDTLKILGVAGGVKAISDLHDIKTMLKEQQEQQVFDRHEASQKDFEQKLEQSKRDQVQLEKDHVVEMERAREKKLQDLQKIKEQNLNIYPKDLRRVEDLALNKNLSLGEAANLFRQTLEGLELFIWLPEYESKHDQMYRDLMKQFGLPWEVVAQCADKALFSGNKFADVLAQQKIIWDQEEQKRLQALSSRVMTASEKRQKQIQEIEEAFEKSKRLGLNFFKVLDEVKSRSAGGNRLAAGICLLVIPLLVAIMVMLIMGGGEGIAAGIAFFIVTFFVMVLPYMLIWRPISARILRSECEKRGFASIPYLFSRGFGDVLITKSQSENRRALETLLKSNDQVVNCIEKGSSATLYILETLGIDFSQVKSESGSGPVAIAIKSGNLSTFMALQDLGLCQDVASCVDLAAISFIPLIVQYLLGHGGKLNQEVASKIQIEKTIAASDIEIHQKLGQNERVEQLTKTLSRVDETADLIEWNLKKAA